MHVQYIVEYMRVDNTAGDCDVYDIAMFTNSIRPIVLSMRTHPKRCQSWHFCWHSRIGPTS